MSRRAPTPAIVMGAVLATGAALLGAEALVTSRRSYLRGEDAPLVSGVYGQTAAASRTDAVRLLLAGDSTAAGVGATSTEATVGGRLAAALASETGRCVVLSSLAVSGARSADLPTQARAAGEQHPTVVVVLIGANDATHRTSPRSVGRSLAAAVRSLRARDVAVVVATCPDLGAARNFAQPLRTVVGWQGRRIARAQAAAVSLTGGVSVPLAVLTGPLFRADPTHLSQDQFHPSDRGYRLWAKVLLPAVLGAIPLSA